MRYLFLLLAFVLPTYASAYTYSRTPTGTEINPPVTVTLNISQAEAEANGWVDNPYLCVDLYAYYDLEDNLIDLDQWSDPEPFVFDTDISFTFTNPVDGKYADVYFATVATAQCGNAETDQMNIDAEYDGNNIIFTIGSISTNELWGSSNGFWGDTTPTQIVGDMEASVQATGVNIWPLMTFVGIPIAFLIAIYLIWLINKTLTPAKKSDENVINPQGENFIYHSAEDLEFKREYGQVKRKRGRPRKYPL